jgi:protein phosphatase
MSQIDPREIRTASLSDVGRTRSSNQDSCAEFVDEAGFRLLVVADGMGGHHGGAEASWLAVEAMKAVFEKGVPEPGGFLYDAFQSASREILRVATGDPDLSGMGTTGVALLFTPGGSAWVAHVGDSRAYRLRRGRLEAITADHSWVAQEVRNGRLLPSEAEDHPNRNILLRSVGVEASVEVEIAEVDIEAGDRFLLCSDGLWGEVDDARIAHVLEREEPEQAVRSLVDLANSHGGHDNVTVQLAWLPGPAIEAAGAQASLPHAPRPPERRAQQHRRRELRIAAAAAAVGALLLVAVLWFFFGGTR